MNLAEIIRQRDALKDELRDLTQTYESEATRIKRALSEASASLVMASDGVDYDAVQLAETILCVGDYEWAGDDGESCVDDAVKQLASGCALSPYKDLWTGYFGTKAFDRWHGQRSDHPYGTGPRHGSIIFRIGVRSSVRTLRMQRDLTAQEVEACLYYLLNIRKIQSSRRLTA